MSALQSTSSDGLQLAPTMLIFGNFRCFNVQFCEPKNSDEYLEKKHVLFLKPKYVK